MGLVDSLKWLDWTRPWKAAVMCRCGTSFSDFFRTLEKPRRFSRVMSLSCSRNSIRLDTSRVHIARSAGGMSLEN